MASGRDQHIFVTEFLLSGESLGTLLAARRINDLQAVLEIVRNDPQTDMAQTDPALYRKLRARITELRVAGWGMDLNVQKCRFRP